MAQLRGALAIVGILFARPVFSVRIEYVGYASFYHRLVNLLAFLS
jgi:hypothetical protein